ncbi:glycosyltransferase family 4 protein [Acidobacteriota bacterium]
MKTLIHTMYYLPEFGSAPILMDELASSLSSMGHEVEVITTIPRPPHHKPYKGKLYVREKGDGFLVKRIRTNYTVHHIGRLIAWTIYTLFTIFNLRTVKRGDILFLRLPPLQLGVMGAIAKKLRKSKIILNVQDIHPDLSIQSGLLKNPTLIKWALAFEKWIYDQSENILVISEGFKKNLTDKGVEPDKVKIIPNWVDTEFLKPMPKDNHLSSKLGISEKFVVMYSGTISISSNLTLQNVLETAKNLQANEDILFVIVGEGLKKSELEEKARNLDLKNVRFLPFQPYEELPALLASSDVLLVPLDREKSLLSVPSKLYNFMAAGRPILGLAQPESEVKLLIEDTGCGLCVPPEDIEDIAQAVLSLKQDTEGRRKMAENSRKYALDNYSRAKVMDDLDGMIRSLSQ